MKPLSGFTNSLNPSSTTMSLSDSGDSSSMFSSIWFWLLTIIILAFVGFYIYFYLAKGMDITDFFLQISQFISGIIASISAIISPSTTTVDIAQQNDSANDSASPGPSTGSVPSPIPNANAIPKQDRDLEHLGKEPQYQPMQPQQMQPPYPTSYPQSNNFPPNNLSEPSAASDGSAKSGWCYVGEDGGNRSCIEANDFDKCLSGNIFPSHDVCINPNLRS